MEFLTCPNCLTVYGDVQSSCPACEADAEGEGARVTFDGATRTVIQGLGGLFGGILDGPAPGLQVLWCSRGVALVTDDIGLAWRARIAGSVDDVRVDAEEVIVTAGGTRTALSLEDGSERE